MLISCIIVSPLYIRCVICGSPYDFIKQIILRQLTVPEESTIELPTVFVKIELKESLINIFMNHFYSATAFSSYYIIMLAVKNQSDNDRWLCSITVPLVNGNLYPQEEHWNLRLPTYHLKIVPPHLGHFIPMDNRISLK